MISTSNHNLAAQAQKAQSEKDLEDVKQKNRIELARYNQGAATARTQMTNDAAMQREVLRQNRLDGRSGSGNKKEKYPRMKFGDSDKTYDINRSTEVAEMYNEGVRRGDFPPIMNTDTDDPTTIENMRQIILQNTGKLKASGVKANTAPYLQNNGSNKYQAPWNNK